ncbi:hypothetical protein KDA00_04990, partial [Candidatus Saccharibacteria bacterium]|nr:hypothetical protein [Candidatus Saccharibacteria bacterium]
MLKREKTGKFGLLVGKALAVASVLLIVLSSLFFVGQQKTEVAQAATTDTLNFQGRLLAAAGNLVDDGIYNMEFSIYYVSSGGSAVWTEDRLVTNTQGVTIKNGYFSVNLGEYDNFGGSINWGNDLYLGMTVRGTSNCAWGACTPADSEMTPRLKLTSVPYAFKAGNVGSNDTNSASTDSKDVSITTGNAAGSTSNSGDITIDVGTATQTAGTISIGTANTSGVTIGRTGVTTTNSGNLLVVGTSTLQGTATFSGVGTDITTGTNEDLTLLANGTGQIILNDTTQIATLGSADTDTLLCRNSSNQFATCTSTFDSSVTLQDAYTNSSSPATITTSDNKNIVFSLADTTTDADFIVDILGTGNTFEIRDGGTAVLTVADGAAVDITGTLDVSGRAAFGANASIASDSIVNVNQDSTVTSGFDYGVRGQLQVNPGSASTGTHVGIAASAVSKSGNSQNIGALAGLSGSARTEGTGTVTDLQGFYSLTYTLSGNATNLYGYHSDALVLGSTSVTNIYGFHSGITHNSSGNTTNAYGAYIDTATDVGSGSITNNYGILVAPQTAGTNDYGIRVDAADTQTLWLSGNADNTTAAAGIAFGASRDTNLYRSAANTLRTDDSLIVGTGLQVVTGDVSISAGALNTNGTQRLSNAGALSNITGYSQSSGNFLQSGAGTFGTGTGAVSLNGATSVTGSNTFTVGTGLSTFGGSVTITGSQFTNQGSTLNSAQAVADLPSGGNIGTAAATVDVNTTFDINQTTASQTITLPTPTDTTSGRIVYVNNVGSASFTMYGSVISAGKSNAFIWNGSTWVTTVSLSGSVVNAIGTIDSQTKSADGAVISTSAIYLQTADATYPGLVSTGTQTFAGNKTFNGDVTLASGAQLFIDDGDVSNLGLAFGTDTNTGLYNLGTDQIGLVAGGTTVAVVSNLSGNPQFMISDGTNSYPGLAFGSDEDTGIYSVAANELGITVGGSNILTASASSISFNG